uniref:MMS19 nucleotide excision repair protein n=1 Tax=Panagrolaimus superbus TaxID=310955 RepID=A0A914YQW7_9BILA
MDSSLLELISLAIFDEASMNKFGTVIVEALKDDIDFDLSRCIIETIERNKGNKDVTEKLTDSLISSFIEGLQINEEICIEDARIKAELLQQIVLKLDQSKVDELADSFVAKWEATDGIHREKLINVTALSILQTKKIDILEKALILTKSTPNFEEVSNYLAFALCIYKQESAEQWISVKSGLLLNRPNALQNLENFLQKFIFSSDISTSHLSALFDFDSAGFNPTMNRYPVSVLWRQRILCQFIPIYVKYFSQIPPSDNVHRSAFFELLRPILGNAQKLTVPLSTELLQILPILTEALELLAEEESPLLDMAVESFVQLLKQASLDSISHEELEKNIKSLQRILIKPNAKISTVIKVLEALELLGKNAPSEIILPAYSCIIGALMNATLSKKRIVRQKAAAVRNQWELAMS